MAYVSHKLKNSFQGALAGGGDPATSPLYVFGPFLRLIVIAGVAPITFGSSIWMVVVTVLDGLSHVSPGHDLGGGRKRR